NIFHTAFDFMERCKQDERIEVALHGAIMSDHGPGLIQVNPPVDPDDIATCLAHLLQNGRSAGTEMNHRHTFPLESIENPLDVRHNIFGIVTGRETADPTIKELNRLSSRLDLSPEVPGEHARKLVHEAMPGGGIAIHHLLGMQIVAGPSPLNGVARKRE